AIVGEDEEAQYWQSLSSPDLTFTLFVTPERRTYRDMGTPPRVFTIYRGPFGLVSMERKEFHALSHFEETSRENGHEHP
ncbi:MAG: hypothetical protein LBB76_07040, partial [Azoarcus sp.]|nr:hypothetical protein [Azoarcus sp.]